MSRVYELGPFRLDPEAGVLTRAGLPMGLGGRAVAVLTALVRAPNEYVRKASLMDAAWPGVVVEENSLAAQISAIRRVLARVPGGERWIETLARRGYRFVGPVTERRDSLGRAVAGQRSNLPEPTTSFVGRERALIEIKRALPRTRLLTLVGVGGIGKTRLALRVATEVMDAYADGVWLVEFAALEDPGLVPQTVATVFGLKGQPSKLFTQTLTEYLKARQLLLVLDNAEHLRAACAQLADVILLQCPHVVMLVTSREALGLPGEPTYRVPSLSTPGPQCDATPESLAPYDSVQLFIERARLNLPHFAVTGENAPALASICCRLDGIPLAIELAAARMRSMSMQDVNRRLDQRFRVLIGESRTAVRRQQTLRALIDWSYDLLSDAEKALLCRASIFAGGWTLEATEQVCVGDGIDDWEVLDLLTSLADKSLVVAEEQRGATRYQLLETVRQYAQDRLRQSGEETRWQDRHLRYFLATAEKAAPQLTGADQQMWLGRLETEHDNLRSALAWSSATGGDTARGLRLSAALSWFWQVRGYLGEARGWFSALLAAASSGLPAAERANALNAAGAMAHQQGDYPAARALHEESLTLRRTLGDQRGIASSLNNLGNMAFFEGDFPSAWAFHHESLKMRQELGDRHGVAISHNNLGAVTYEQGDFASARKLYEESLAEQRELGDRQGIAASLNNLGNVARAQGDFASARRLYEESLADYRELGDRQGIAESLNNLGRVACERGDLPATRALHEESLAIRRELGDRRGIAESLEGFADVAFTSARPCRAARIWGAAEQLRNVIGAPLPRSDCAPHERQVSAARVALGDDAAFDEAWREGRAMTPEQIFEYVLEERDS